MPALKRGLTQRDHRVISRTIEVAEAIGRPMTPILLQVAKNKDKIVRENAVNLLGKLAILIEPVGMGFRILETE